MYEGNAEKIIKFTPSLFKTLLVLLIILPIISMSMGFDLGLITHSHIRQSLYLALYQWSIALIAVVILLLSTIDYLLSKNNLMWVLGTSFLFSAYFYMSSILWNTWVYQSLLDAENVHAYIWLFANSLTGGLLISGMLFPKGSSQNNIQIILLILLLPLSEYFLITLLHASHLFPIIVFPEHFIKNPTGFINFAVHISLILTIFFKKVCQNLIARGMVYYAWGQCIMSLYVTFVLVRHYESNYFGSLFLQLCSYLMILFALISRYAASYAQALKTQENIRQEKDKFKQLASRDHLTNLHNRRAFEETAERLLALSKRHQRRSALLFLDIDNFKTINDQINHEAGDEVLRQMANRLKCLFRQEDVCARLGGDEFAIFIPEIINAASVNQIISKLMKQLSYPYFLDGTQLSVTVSLGVALYPEDGDCLQSLLQKADEAMYRVKLKGKKGFAFYSEIH
ncbi:GGDEF domain-containing protein [Legionella jordanis]|uniref:GGDEF domain-containing protein n=1 Tax=Legionella jordanis TaxID=456 RepID=UPI000EFFF1E8|nr:GGDEF domain-containing protein [Legionella jordanis]RMX20936.1 GGDEF domain-containing protein [Legionella jordanis]